MTKLLSAEQLEKIFFLNQYASYMNLLKDHIDAQAELLRGVAGALEALHEERLQVSDMMCDSADDYGYLGSALFVRVNNALLLPEEFRGGR